VKSYMAVCFNYFLSIAIFLNIDISQGSVATRLRCGLVGYLHMALLQISCESNSERILKIGQYLVKLWARVRCLVFLTHGVCIKICNLYLHSLRKYERRCKM